MAAPGASAPSSYSVNYDALLSTTLYNYRKTLVDNIFKNSVLLSLLKMNGGIRYTDGGERIACPLMYGKNDTVKSYSGYETLDVKPQDGLTTAFYEWAEIAGTISISRKEERQNSGEAQLINLLEGKIKQAEMSLREEINIQLVGGTVSAANYRMLNGNSGKDLLPLGYFGGTQSSLDPSGTGVVDIGNISQNTYSWWRNMSMNFGASAATGEVDGLAITTFAGMIVGLRRFYNHCAKGSGGAPDIVLLDQKSFETYENAVDQRSRIQNTKLGEIGFDTIKLRGADCAWDEVVPDLYGDGSGTPYVYDSSNFATGSAFFINTDFTKLAIDKATDFVTTPFIEPENQTAKTAKILFMGQLTCDNLRKFGSVNRISQSIVA